MFRLKRDIEQGRLVVSRLGSSGLSIRGKQELNPNEYTETESTKFRIDLIIASVWEAYSRSFSLTINPDILKNISVWGIYETALKTQFHFKDYVENIDGTLEISIGCKLCKQEVSMLLVNESPINERIYCSECPCLMEWKKDMRLNHFTAVTWAPFNYTVMMVKPHVVAAKRDKALNIIGADCDFLMHKTIILNTSDIAFLYSTAYGKQFLRDQINYYSSGKSEVYLIKGDDIVERQEGIKKQIRESLGVADPRRNIVHFPDSLGETYSQIAYFFGEDVLVELINHGT